MEASVSQTSAQLVEAVTAAAEADTLRFLTCGSVDDGKSTLIGRLLFDSQLLMEDQIDQLKRDSEKHGTAGDEIDFALLVDGLEAAGRLGELRAPSKDRGEGALVDSPRLALGGALRTNNGSFAEVELERRGRGADRQHPLQAVGAQKANDLVEAHY